MQNGPRIVYFKGCSECGWFRSCKYYFRELKFLVQLQNCSEMIKGAYRLNLLIQNMR